MRCVRRLLTLAVAVCALLVSGAGLAQAAEPYPIPPPVVTVDRATIIVGESVVVSGSNFGASEIIDVIDNFQGAAMGQLGRSARGGLLAGKDVTVTADDTGHFSVTVRLDRVGTHVLVATGRTTGRTGSVTVKVLPEGSQLPTTGNDGSYLGIILIGSAIVLAGASLLVFARVRRRTSKVES